MKECHMKVTYAIIILTRAIISEVTVWHVIQTCRYSAKLPGSSPGERTRSDEPGLMLCGPWALSVQCTNLHPWPCMPSFAIFHQAGALSNHTLEGRERGSLLPRNQIIKEKVKTISEPEFWFLKFSWNHLRYAHKIPLSLTLRNTAKIIFWDKKKFHDSQTTKEMQVLFSRTVRGHREIFSSERWSGNILEILSVRITESWGGWPPGKLSASWSRNWAAYRHSFSCLATTSSQVKHNLASQGHIFPSAVKWAWNTELFHTTHQRSLRLLGEVGNIDHAKVWPKREIPAWRYRSQETGNINSFEGTCMVVQT